MDKRTENVISLDEFRTKKGKAQIFIDMKGIYGLQDWRGKFNETLDNGNMGECYCDWENKDFEISFKPGLGPEEWFDTLIHELEHVVSWEFRELDWLRKLVSARAFSIIENRLAEIDERIVTHREEINSRVWKLLREPFTSNPKRK